MQQYFIILFTHYGVILKRRRLLVSKMRYRLPKAERAANGLIRRHVLGWQKPQH
jgi:hypothetical protein